MAAVHYPRPRKQRYSIYDKPDNDDCAKKVVYGTGYGALFGTTVAMYDSIGYTKPGTLIGVAKRWAFHTTLFAGAAGAYTSVMVMSASIRNKDDPYNHFWGGLAAGSVFGTKMGSQKIGWGLGIAFGLAGMTIKLFRMSGVKFFPTDQVRAEKSFYDYNRSYLTERPPSEGNIEI